VSEASRAYDLSPSEVEKWVDDAKRGMENALRANPLDVKEQYERQIKGLQEAYGEAMLELTRELLGWHLSRSGKATTASSALEHARLARFGTLGRVPAPFLLRSDNGLVFTSRSYTALVRSYGLRQEFITPHCRQQNGMVERVIRTLKEQCAHRHRFESVQQAGRVIGDWIRFYNHRRPHQALNM